MCTLGRKGKGDMRQKSSTARAQIWKKANHRSRTAPSSGKTFWSKVPYILPHRLMLVPWTPTTLPGWPSRTHPTIEYCESPVQVRAPCDMTLKGRRERRTHKNGRSTEALDPRIRDIKTVSYLPGEIVQFASTPRACLTSISSSGILSSSNLLDV